MKTAVIMRSHNDMPLIADTLAKLHRQRHPFDLFVFDNASKDGTLEEVKKYTENIFHVPKGSYVPGRVLNQAMDAVESELVIFLNSDCTPQHDDWLDHMVSGFEDETAAVFGRQIPRPDCHPLFYKDTEATFGDGAQQKYWRHCFSMASSGIRKSVWETMPFDESLQYSEDIDWTWRVRQAGKKITYIPDAVVMHSHNYTVKQFYKRQYGEGKAEAFIFDWSPWQRHLFRYSILPYIRQILADFRYCLKTGNLTSIFFAPVLRMSQMLGRRRGFLDGWAERMRQKATDSQRNPNTAHSPHVSEIKE